MVPWEKKTLPSHRYKKVTIVEVYPRLSGSTAANICKCNEISSIAVIFQDPVALECLLLA